MRKGLSRHNYRSPKQGGGASLNLQFAGASSLDPRITFTRASSGTYFDSAGVLQTATTNTPRLTYNPSTLAALGLLIEEQRTNLLTYSEQFDNAAWTKSNATVTANATTAPDGTVTADKLVEDTTFNQHISGQFIGTVSVGDTYTISCYIKAAGRTQAALTSYGEAYVAFDLSAGTVIQGTGQIQSVGNGWYRCSAAFTKTNTTGNFYVLTWNNSNMYTGNGTSGIFIWGAQVEAGAFPTSYIPTVAAQVTRSADNASMTGTNFSSWYNASEGTVYAETQTVDITSSIKGIFAIGNSSLGFGSANVIYGVFDPAISGRVSQIVITSGINQAQISPTYTQLANTATKTAQVYKVNDYAISVNAVSPDVDTVGSVPSGVTGMSIGNLSSGWSGATQYLNGTIARITYYPRRLSNADLQAITT